MFKEIALSEAQQLERALAAAEESFQMDEQTFRTLYERTARPLWSYLYRVSGDGALADDLMQEAYYRILRVRLPEMNQDFMRNYLFRIATNLLRDHWRRGKSEGLHVSISEDAENQEVEASAGKETAEAMDARSDLNNALQRLKPRERELLWLAYVEGSSHKEIAEVAGLKEQSIRPLLFRARHKLAALIRAGRIRPKTERA